MSVKWTPEQIASANEFQRAGMFHPFTCGNDRGDAAHRAYAAEHGDPDFGLLVATEDGWRCPACDYRQAGAHGFMLDGSWKEVAKGTLAAWVQATADEARAAMGSVTDG